MRYVRLATLLSLFAAVVLAAGTALAAPQSVHHDLEVRLDPRSRHLNARDTIRITGQGMVKLRLAPHFALMEFSVDGRRQSPIGSGGNWLFVVEGEGEHTVKVEYAGVLPALPEDRRRVPYGMPVTSEQGSYLPPGAAWYPEIEGVERFTYTLRVGVPDPHRAVAPGRLSDEGVANGHYRATFTAEHPADGIVLLTGPYRIAERQHGNIRLRTYFYSEIEDLSDVYLDKTAEYLDLYNDWIGDYPFSAFHVVAGPLPVGLGFRNLTYIGTAVLRLPFIRETSLGHEVLHNWWGNGVYPDYSQGNWAEGLTTFMADYTYALREGPDRARAMRLDWLRDYAALPADRDRPAVAFDAKSHDASQVVGYNKVAFFFHMLRRRIGEEAFDKGVARFWERYRFDVAEWSDLRGAFEDAAGERLDWFFDQWLRRESAPRLRLTEATVSDAPDGGYGISLTIEQEVEGRPFLFTLPIRIDTVAGPRTFELGFNNKKATMMLRTDARPTRVALDPEYHVFRRLAPGETPPILRDITLASAPAVVILGDGRFADTARDLARRLADTDPRFHKPDPAGLPDAPTIVIGPAGAAEDFVREAGLGPVPSTVAGRGTARVWTTRQDGGAARVVIAAEDASSLHSLLGPLPHYGRQSYLVFQGREVVDKGVWPMPEDSPVTARLGAGN